MKRPWQYGGSKIQREKRSNNVFRVLTLPGQKLNSMGRWFSVFSKNSINTSTCSKKSFFSCGTNRPKDVYSYYHVVNVAHLSRKIQTAINKSQQCSCPVVEQGHPIYSIGWKLHFYQRRKTTRLGSLKGTSRLKYICFEVLGPNFQFGDDPLLYSFPKRSFLNSRIFKVVCRKNNTKKDPNFAPALSFSSLVVELCRAEVNRTVSLEIKSAISPIR